MTPPEFHFRGVTYSPRAGGHSGAGVFVGAFAGTPAFAVKRHTISAERLRWVHAKLNIAPDFVPKPVAAADGRTVVEWRGAAWDCTPWAAGVAVRPPNGAQKIAAFAALAGLHRAWRVETEVVFPAVQRRLDVLRNGGAGRPLTLTLSPEAGERELNRRIADAVASLEPLFRPVPCRPCVCDGHAEHFLFDGDRLIAVIDFAAMKIDHPAVDVARLAEDWDVPPDEATALYLLAGGDPAVSPELVFSLAVTGTLAAWIGWQNRPGGGERRSRLSRRLFGP